MKKASHVSRDPYYYWKMISMVLACAVLILAILILFGRKRGTPDSLVLSAGSGHVGGDGHNGAGEK